MNSDRNDKDKLKVSSTGKVHDTLSIHSEESEVGVNIKSPDQYAKVPTTATTRSEPKPLDFIEIPATLLNKGMIKINVYPKDDHTEKPGSALAKL